MFFITSYQGHDSFLALTFFVYVSFFFSFSFACSWCAQYFDNTLATYKSRHQFVCDILAQNWPRSGGSCMAGELYFVTWRLLRGFHRTRGRFLYDIYSFKYVILRTQLRVVTKSSKDQADGMEKRPFLPPLPGEVLPSCRNHYNCTRCHLDYSLAFFSLCWQYLQPHLSEGIIEESSFMTFQLGGEIGGGWSRSVALILLLKLASLLISSAILLEIDEDSVISSKIRFFAAWVLRILNTISCKIKSEEPGHEGDFVSSSEDSVVDI